MAYFKIGSNDYSKYVCELKVRKKHNYSSQTNAAGNSVVDYINQKREIEVGIIPLSDSDMAKLQADIDSFNVKISYLEPKTKSLVTNVNCIIPENNVEYYTIQTGKTIFKQFNLKFIEL